MLFKKIWTTVIFYIAFVFSVPTAFATQTTKSNLTLFQINHYNQNVNYWLNPKKSDYHTKLLSKEGQLTRFHQLKHTYYGTGKNDKSPWSKYYVTKLLKSKPSLTNVETKIIDKYAKSNTQATNPQQINYGVNFRPYSSSWFLKLKKNMQLGELTNIKYSRDNRAIITQNSYLRKLPTKDPFFHNRAYAGQGYPFDNLQETAIFVGTPVYILGETVDKKWNLVLSPNYVGWVNSVVVGRVHRGFIGIWQQHAYEKLIGITNTDVSIINKYGKYQFTGYVGMLFPSAYPETKVRRWYHKSSVNKVHILIPVRHFDGTAVISTATIKNIDAAQLPLSVTKANFAFLIKRLQGRPYGWGNLNFYNDCSSELKALYALFGIYLPRNTNGQLSAGKVVDLSKLTAANRIKYLMKRGKPLMTLIYIKGHIMLYVGSYTDKSGNKFPLTYQQMWGFKPHDLSYRSVVGMSVFMPLLKSYPENKDFISLAAFSTFKLIYLNDFSQGDGHTSWRYFVH